MKMKVEVWSDIMCPFCYIGKRNYESALAQFSNRGDVEIIWKSFQLDPGIPEKMEQKQTVYNYLADRKGMSYAQSVNLHTGVVETAKRAGLEYRFDIAVVANSLNAHRLIQMAKTKGLGDRAEERLFHGYFSEGQDFGDRKTLLAAGKDIGLTGAEAEQALTDDEYAYAARQDIQEARTLGIRSVPFFVFDRKYAISGAQPPEAFLQTLEKSFAEWRKENPQTAFETSHGPSCATDGICD